MPSLTFVALYEELRWATDLAQSARDIEQWLAAPEQVLHWDLLGLALDPETGLVEVSNDADPGLHEVVSPEVVRSELITVGAIIELQRQGCRTLTADQERVLRAAGAHVGAVREALQGLG